MKNPVIFLLMTLPALLFSQTRNIRINVYRFDISQDSIYVFLNSQAENLNLCRLQIVDSLNNVLITGDFPKARSKPGIKQWTAKTFYTSELAPGRYNVVLYIGKEEFYRKTFRRLKQ